MMKLKRMVCGALAVLLLAGCGPKGELVGFTVTKASQAPEAAPTEGAPTEQVELMVSAAASLTDCMQELADIYTADHPNIKITFNFGASGSLQQQIEQGAPADIFFSAGKKQMAALQEKGLMEDDTVQDMLENKVVLITPKDGAALDSFEALAGDAVKQIGVGEPESVPVGQYTAEIFGNLGLADQLKDKLVYAKDVREVLSWVETGNVDAGVVYETDAMISGKVQVSCMAPEGSHKRVIYPMGVTKDSQVKAEAQAFLDFLSKSDLASAAFAKYGFTPVRPEPKG